MKYITEKTSFNTYKFEIVEKIPAGYFVWNVGKLKQHEDYLALAENLPCEKFLINPNTLKAIKIKDDKTHSLLMRGASYGVGSLSKCKKILERKNAKYKELAERLQPIFEELTEWFIKK